MTLDDLKAINREWLTPAQVAPVLGADPHYIRIQARQRPDLLGFPVVVVGTRTKIPRKPFLRYMEGGRTHDDV